MRLSQNSYLGDRYEFKYILNPILAAKIQNYIEKVGLIADDNSLNGAYTVNSMYFDTPFLDDYRDKDGSLLVRKKMRARMYDESWFDEHKHVFMEIKGKRDFKIKKVRERVSGDSWSSFIDENNPLRLEDKDMNEKKRNFLNRFSYLYLKGRYSPHVIIKYKRAAYLDQFTDKIRVTFDSDIRSCFAKDEIEESFMMPIFPDRVIMEIKFRDKLPWWFSKMTDIFDIHRSDFSKYNHSVATLRDSYRIPVSR